MTVLKKYLYIVALLVGSIGCLSSCSDVIEENVSKSPAVTYNEDGSLNLTLEVEIPRMTTLATRAMGETPNYSDLNLYLLVFDSETGNLRQTQVIRDLTPTGDDVHTQKQYVKFNATFYPTDGEATVHLIASNQDLSQDLTAIGWEYMLRSICTTNGNEAYWARVPLGMNIPSAGDANSDEVAKEIAGMLSHVPMVRNFCRVSVTSSVDNFTPTRLHLVNVTDRGSVVPYLTDDDKVDDETRNNNGFVKFFKEAYIPRNYSEISATGYIGEPPTGTVLQTGNNNVVSAADNDALNVYLYERPYRNANRTYAIVEGTYGTGNNSSTRFYKVDIGAVAEDDKVGRFKYYNFIRNFDYKINILSVTSAGYSTLEAAMNGSVSNNLWGTVDVENLSSISDGTDRIAVSFTNYVFTANTPKTVDLRALYMNGNSPESDKLDIVFEGEDMLERIGNPIRRNDSIIWTIGIKDGVELTSTAKQQTAYVYRGDKGDGTYGLYRVIKFTLISQFEIEHIDTYPGLWEDWETVPWDWSEDKREIGQGIDAPLTLFFELQEGLPESIFPLEFVIESSKQNIQNAYQGNAVVKTVPAAQSLFWNNGNGGVNTARIQFVKTVTWEDYNTVGTTESPATGSRIVRCRFLTTTDLAQDGIGGAGANGESTTTLKVSNPYFAMQEDGFTRNSKTSDPSPKIWDFSSSDWTTVMDEIQGGSRNNWTSRGEVNGTGLTIVAGGTNANGTANSLYSGTEEEEGTIYRYIRTSSDNNYFQFTHAYPGSDARTAQLVITASNVNNDEDNVANVDVTAIGASSVTVNDNTGFTKRDTRVFNIAIPANTASNFETTVRIKPSGPMRIYKIEYYPRGTEQWSESQQP